MEKLSLLPHQVKHVESLKETLTSHPFALDFSGLGTGKTFTASSVAMDGGFSSVVVICPGHVMPRWNFMKERYGIPIKVCMSYETMCSKSQDMEVNETVSWELKHQLLRRTDKCTLTPYTCKKAIHSSFEPTEKFMDMVQKGVLLVYDECQHMKNTNKQLSAARVLVQAIYDQDKSRVLVMSGSPIDKVEQAVSIFVYTGVMKSDRLYDYDNRTKEYNYTGMLEIEEFCRKIDQNLYYRFRGYGVLKRKECIRCIYTLFQGVFKPKVAHSMDPPKLAVSLHQFNGMFEIYDQENADMLGRATNDIMNELRKAKTEHNQVINPTSVNFNGLITIALQKIELAKVETFARIAMDALWSNPMCKVVLCLNFIDSINELAKILEEFNPMVMMGATPPQVRQRYIRRFQGADLVHGDLMHRLMLANPKVICSGIDLDDKRGDYPRTCFVSPTFDTIMLYQLAFRFCRVDTKSDAYMYMVYINGFSEDNIMKALMKKGGIMQQTTEKQTKHGIVFPGNYPTFLEEAEQKHE